MASLYNNIPLQYLVCYTQLAIHSFIALKRSSHTDLSIHMEPVFAPQIHLYLNLVLVIKSGCIGRAALAHNKTKNHCNQNAGNMTATCYWL